jgi:hypothetical protein
MPSEAMAAVTPEALIDDVRLSLLTLSEME